MLEKFNQRHAKWLPALGTRSIAFRDLFESLLLELSAALTNL